MALAACTLYWALTKFYINTQHYSIASCRRICLILHLLHYKNTMCIRKEATTCILRHLLTLHNLPGAIAWSVACTFCKQRPAIDPRVRNVLSWKNYFPVPLIQEEQVVSYWQKNWHLILEKCLREACPGTVWLK